jgi:hypothetical protein
MAERQAFVDFEVEADFEKIQEFGGGGYSLIPEGDFIFEVVHLEQEVSKNNNQMVVVYSAVCEGQETDEAAKQTGEEARSNYVLTEKAMGRLKQLMIACGAPLDKFRASAIMGAKYRGTIVHSTAEGEAGPDGQPKEGKTYANVTNERPLESGETEAAPPPPPIAAKKATAPAAKPTAPAAKPPAAKPTGNSAGQPRRA